MELSGEQKKRIEENRRRAMQLRAQKAQTSSIIHPPPEVSTVHNKKVVGTIPSSDVQNSSSLANVQLSNNKFLILNTTPNLPSNSNLAIASKVKASCFLISNKRFQVKSSFFTPLIDLFKCSRTKIYDTQCKQWSFDLNEYEFIKNEIQKKMASIVEFEGFPKHILSVFSKKMRSPNPKEFNAKFDLSKIDGKLLASLLPFQKEGVEFCIRNNGRLLIADDMGLGKTLQAIAVADYFKDEWPLLVITPSSVKFTWLQQLLAWLPSLDREDVTVVQKRSEVVSDCRVLISSYDLVTKNSKEILDRQFKVVIVDESHLLKSSNSQRTKNINPILMQASRVLLLSGTPALSRPIELFSQLTCLDPKVFNSAYEYGIRYCAAKKQTWGWDYSGSSNLNELKILLEEKYLIRRMKTEVLQQLPRKYRTMVVLDPSLISHDKSMKQSHFVVEKSKGTDRKHLLEYFHKTAEAKSNAVCKYVLDLLESGKKFLVFAHHQIVLDSLEQLVSGTHEYIRIDGKTNPEQRNFFCEKFQTNERVRIAILSIMAVNAGINMSAANLVVFAELFWNPGILVQAEDRAHRIGQMDSVNVQYLVAKNTSDDFIWPMVQNKLELLSKAGISGHTFKDSEMRFMTDSNQRSITSFMKSTTEEIDELTDDDLMRSLDCNFDQSNNHKNPMVPMKSNHDDNLWGNDDDLLERLPPKRKPRIS